MIVLNHDSYLKAELFFLTVLSLEEIKVNGDLKKKYSQNLMSFILLSKF